jgi:protein SCO1/2
MSAPDASPPAALVRWLAHPLVGPLLALGALGLGALTVAFLLVGPALGSWADTLLTACFGWNAETRRYRLDALLLALGQPPLFAGVVLLCYRDEVAAFLRTRRGRLAAVFVAGSFLSLGASLLVTGEISASGAPPRPESLPGPVRRGEPAPAFALVDHRGQAVSLAALRGRPAVMTFFYASCHSACPLLIARLRSLEEAQPDGSPAAFLAVTLDPEQDRPEALAATAERWGLGPRWHLLTGDPEQVRQVARDYGVGWARRPDGEIAHENLILLLDRQGRLAFTYRGLAQPEARQLRDLARLVAEAR